MEIEVARRRSKNTLAHRQRTERTRKRDWTARDCQQNFLYTHTHTHSSHTQEAGALSDALNYQNVPVANLFFYYFYSISDLYFSFLLALFRRVPFSSCVVCVCVCVNVF